eukprot:767161-Hanusia_phi.AAC.6
MDERSGEWNWRGRCRWLTCCIRLKMELGWGFLKSAGKETNGRGWEVQFGWEGAEGEAGEGTLI